MKWYKRDPDAALGGMAELSFAECGAYNRLIDLLYSRDGQVLDDDVFCARCFHCNPRTWRKLKKRLIARGKVWAEGGYLHATRVDETIIQAGIVSENQRNKVRMRWERARKAKEINNSAIQPGNTLSKPDKNSSFFLTAAREKPKQTNSARSLATAPSEGALTREPDSEPAEPKQGATDKEPEEMTLAEINAIWYGAKS